MKRILLTLEYDGTNFYGWQKQSSDIRTVQGEIEKALEALTDMHCEVYGSGRTDAGVHALAQTAHFDLPVNIPLSKLKDVLNSLLPDDIAVKQLEEVSFDFHARFSIKKKCYRYKLYIGNEKDAFLANHVGYIKYSLDEELMEKCKNLIIGRHNFKGFCSSATCAADFVRTVYEINIIREGDFYYFDVVGSGFLYNMVRIIVGTIIDVGRGQLTLESVKEALANGDRAKAGVTMPAGGLYLKYTEY